MFAVKLLSTLYTPFPLAAPVLWNALPPGLRAINNIITGLPVWQTQSESTFHFEGLLFFVFFFLFFSVSGKVLPVTPLLSGVFVHRVFCAYFVRFEGAGVMR